MPSDEDPTGDRGIGGSRVERISTLLSAILSSPTMSDDDEISHQDGRRGMRSCSSSWISLFLKEEVRARELPMPPPPWGDCTAPEAKKLSMESFSTPFLFRSSLSFLFSSATLRATTWISAEASIPCISTSLRRCSSSWTYSLRRARDRLWFSLIRARFDFSCDFCVCLC